MFQEQLKTGCAQEKSAKPQGPTMHVRCTQCKQPIDVSNQANYLAREGNLIRVRCLHETCRMEDWYSEAEFEGALPPDEVIPQRAQVHWYDILTSGI